MSYDNREDSSHFQPIEAGSTATIANLSLLLEVLQGMYVKCSKTDLIINSGSGLASKLDRILSVKMLGNPVNLACQIQVFGS
ncbi:uncharacterized protein OCT59_024949 [Rhizophagus irregularis]|uniref:uncharacterized protein n=1 Tax=Rhizophagus irregularis TaxID=588596 RepID=UPI00332C758A|nr:hypothetical protein OCT59_024949 [Rhizophagus irregularis]